MSPLVPSFPMRVVIALAVPLMVATDVAVTSPVVLLFKVFNTLAATVVSVTVTASSPNPENPLEAYAVFISAAAPVIVATVDAFTVPGTLPFTAFNTVAVIVVSLSVAT